MVRNRALTIGISNYPPGIRNLPAVTHDVRAMADLLGSSNGSFASGDVRVLLDSHATKQAIREALADSLGLSEHDDTVFVYLAGHGELENENFYFIPYDTRPLDLAGSAIPLKEIKTLFDQAPSNRVLLWLDFCYSGAILSRNAEALGIRDVTVAMERVLSVTQGHGKVIMCACTAEQKAYERPDHGLFTKYLLNGLRGAAANAAGEVTASSLHDYIDKEIGSAVQRPLFFGEMAGRIVLMHSQGRVTHLSPSLWRSFKSKLRIQRTSETIDIGLAINNDRILIRLPDGNICDESAVVARRSATEAILAVGNEAQSILETTPPGVTAFRPIQYGVVADDSNAVALLHGCLKGKFSASSFRVVAAVPCSSTKVERDALRRVLERLGAEQTFLIPSPLLAAIGAELPVEEPHGFGVINFGEQVTDIGVVFSCHMPHYEGYNVGTNDFDAIIRGDIEYHKKFLISQRTAQEVRQHLGTGYQLRSETTMTVKGRDRTDGQRDEVTIGSNEMKNISLEAIETVAYGIHAIRERCPIGLTTDLFESGFFIVGRGALVPGMVECLTEVARLRFHLSTNPLRAVIDGTATALAVIPPYLL